MATMCTRLAVVLLAAALASAGPVPTSKPVTTRSSCHVGRFQSLSPSEVDTFRKAKNALEEWVSRKGRGCTSRPFPKTRDLRHLQEGERLVALEAELDLTLRVLGALAASPLGPVLDQPLRTLGHIHTWLRACVPALPTAGPPAGGHLQRWLQRLQDASKKESRSCLEVAVTSNLLRLLTQDLKHVQRTPARVR